MGKQVVKTLHHKERKEGGRNGQKTGREREIELEAKDNSGCERRVERRDGARMPSINLRKNDDQ